MNDENYNQTNDNNLTTIKIKYDDDSEEFFNFMQYNLYYKDKWKKYICDDLDNNIVFLAYYFDSAYENNPDIYFPDWWTKSKEILEIINKYGVEEDNNKPYNLYSYYSKEYDRITLDKIKNIYKNCVYPYYNEVECLMNISMCINRKLNLKLTEIGDDIAGMDVIYNEPIVDIHKVENYYFCKLSVLYIKNGNDDEYHTFIENDYIDDIYRLEKNNSNKELLDKLKIPYNNKIKIIT